MRRFPLGSYPTVGVGKARKDAAALHVKVKQEGADPVAQRRKERAMGDAAKAGQGTLAAVLDTYTTMRGGKQKAWVEARKRIELVFKTLLARPIAALSAGDFQMLADAYKAQSSASYAVRHLRPVIKWAAQRGYTAAATAVIHPPATVQRRQRVLSRDELAALLPTLSASDRPYAAALRFMLLTVARREEVGATCWRQVDLTAKTWTIIDTKNGQPHVVPLSHQALSLLRSQLPRDRDGKTLKPAPGALIFATSAGARLSNWDRETKVIMEASGTEGWTRHDLRRTGATMLGDMGELPDIIEAALNHTAIRSQLAATYNRSRYRPQVALALQRLADALDGIEAGAGEVVPLRNSHA